MSRDDEETRAEDKDAYFVSYREVKVGKRVKVYLTKGGPDARRKQKPEEVLAAVGEDSGPKTGARFRNAANFTEHGHLDSDSRREVSEWLDGIVAEGLAREAAAGAGEGSDDTPFGGTPVASGVDSNRAPAEPDMDASAAAAVHEQPPAIASTEAPAPVPLAQMTFVNHSQEKFVFPDGRRGVRFYLVTERGDAVLAAVGEERDTRDGHYVYRKDDAFNRGPPLTCGNLIGVSRWLRDQCVNGALVGAPLAGFGSHPPKRKNGGGGKSGSKSKRGGGAPLYGGTDGAPLYGKDGALLSAVVGTIPLGSIASADPHWYAERKRKRDSRFFAADHAGDDVEPPSVATAFAERETRWATSRRAALAYAREEPDADLVAEIEKTHEPTLRECEAFCATRTASKKQTKTYARADERASLSSATRALETLRALEGRHVNLRVLRETGVCASVARLKTHADATVRLAASSLLSQWLAALQTHVGTMAATYERPPAPRAGASGGAGGGARGAAGGTAGKPPRPKPVYDAAFIASRRNEPELRRTRESRDEVMRREAAERAAREAAAKGQREAAAARAAANKAAKAAAAAAAAAVPGAAFPGSPVAEKGALSAFSRSERRDAPAEREKEKKKSRGASASAMPGTPLGKGRKLCTGCNTVVGSPTRVCPHCNATLPLKQTTTGARERDPGSSPRFGGASGSAHASNAQKSFSFPSAISSEKQIPGSSPPGSARAASDLHAGYSNPPGSAFGVSDGVVVDGRDFLSAGEADGEGEGSASVAQFLARHQERFASCKVSQLKRAVADLSAGVRRILDAGRVRDPALAKSLRESMKKMGDVKLLQGVVERPRARREVVAHLEAAIKACHARGA